MKRIAVFKNYYGRPTKDDFEANDAHILVDRLLAYHVIKPDGKVRMIHPYQIDEVTIRNNMGGCIEKTMCELINNLPETIWQQIIRELNFK
ncbi:MAG: hypothetical protein ACK5Z5_09490 [Neisseriaceae bacterium]